MINHLQPSESLAVANLWQFELLACVSQQYNVRVPLEHERERARPVHVVRPQVCKIRSITEYIIPKLRATQLSQISKRRTGRANRRWTSDACKTPTHALAHVIKYSSVTRASGRASEFQSEFRGCWKTTRDSKTRVQGKNPKKSSLAFCHYFVQSCNWRFLIVDCISQ